MRENKFTNIERAAMRDLVIDFGLTHQQAANVMAYFADAIGINIEAIYSVLNQSHEHRNCVNKTELSAVRRLSILNAIGGAHA